MSIRKKGAKLINGHFLGHLVFISISDEVDSKVIKWQEPKHQALVKLNTNGVVVVRNPNF